MLDSAVAISKSSVGEPSTQMTLNTFHFAGAIVLLGSHFAEGLTSAQGTARRMSPSVFLVCEKSS